MRFSAFLWLFELLFLGLNGLIFRGGIDFCSVKAEHGKVGGRVDWQVFGGVGLEGPMDFCLVGNRAGSCEHDMVTARGGSVRDRVTPFYVFNRKRIVSSADRCSTKPRIALEKVELPGYVAEG